MIYTCKKCEQVIDITKRRKNLQTNPPMFCSQKCQREWNKETGWMSLIGQQGNESQSAYKEKYGEIPKKAKRSQAVAQANRLAPKRGKKS